MEVIILNIYSNETDNRSDLIGDHGQSFLITVGDEKILFDTGSKGNILLHNMKKLNISPDDITKLVISHGHYDHTGGLPAFLDGRTNTTPIPTYAHPSFQEEKFIKLGIIKKRIGCPVLTAEQLTKLDLHLSKKPQQVADYLTTTGEIKERNELDGIEKSAVHFENGKLVQDPILDDLSLIIATKKGNAIIAGCAHSGILNICNFVSHNDSKKIIAIIGGTHMVRYSGDEVIHVANQLENKYGYPDLFLNHCTDKFPFLFVKKTKAIDILKMEFNEAKVKKCFVGTEISFEC